MIPQISEINFPDYATLHQATVSLSTMGERSISTQIRIDGDIVPEFGVTRDGVFYPMELEFKGERFILPTREPQAAKDNTTRNSLVDLTFTSWPIYQMKRYFFVEMASVTAGTAIADKYNASLALNVVDFVEAFNLVLDYYFDGKIVMDLFNPGGIYSTAQAYVNINYSYIWDVLEKIYEIYDVKWWIEYDSIHDVYIIKVGYTAEGIDDHDFEYGYEGGLLKFERQVQDDDITNILLGRGGEKNLPYRYFKRIDQENPEWAADPDAIPELANIYFDRLRDINFRNYVQGWRTNPHRDTSWESVQTYDSSRGATDWAYAKGHFDDKFDPSEYVADEFYVDENEILARGSIEKYGEHWGALDDNDDIFPTIQGVALSGLGRVDEVVDVSEIVTDDITAYAEGAAVENTIEDVRRSWTGETRRTWTLESETFTIPTGETGNITYRPLGKDDVNPNLVFFDTTNSTVQAITTSGGSTAATSGSYDSEEGTFSIAGIPAGTYRLRVNLVIRVVSPATTINGTFGIENIVLTTSATNTNAWKPTFDIWVKNIWQTTQGANESNDAYSERVWLPILGDRVGNEAKIVFSSGPLASVEDYEFVIASFPEVDRTKSIVTKDSDGTTTITVPSEWKITVYKSDAEFDATGLYIPNAQSLRPYAGNYFFFVGIDMPHLYVVWAEQRLNAYKENALQGMSNVNPTWVITLDKVRVHTLEESDYQRTLADRLATGITIRTKDRRFTNGDVLTLYIQSITYTWNEPSEGNPYMVPDIEVVLSDKLASVESPVSKLQGEVEVISQAYVDVTDVEQVVRRVAGSLYLKKTGESDSSSSPTTFSSKVTSRNFRKGGVGGRGWGLYEDNSETYASDVITQTQSTRGAMLSAPAPTRAATNASATQETKSVFEVDRLIVRQEMEVNSLVVNQIAYVGGKEIISAAKIEVTMVIDNGTSYVCYFDQKQNSVANLFQVNDIAYGQVWNADNSNLRYYKMLVTAVDINSITLSKSVRDGSGIPAKGDVIVQFGNVTNADRQFVILRDVIGGGYEQMLSGLNSVYAAGNEYYYAGFYNDGTTHQPRWFVGAAAGEYAEWINGQLVIKGQLYVKKNDNSYEAMSTYIAEQQALTDSLQSQIDGQIESFEGATAPLPQLVNGSVDYSTANAPASGWTTDTEREKHKGDIFTDNSTGHLYRYTRQEAAPNYYYWMLVQDEEVAEVVTGLSQLQYLKTATNDGTTTIDGGLILSSLIQLGMPGSGGSYNVWSGINGTINSQLSNPMESIAAWFGGPMVDHEKLPSAPDYAKSLFRMDGSGYLAGGNITWENTGYGSIPGITWQNNGSGGTDVVIGANVKLSSISGDTVTDLLSYVQALNNMFELDSNGDIHVKDNRGLWSDSFISGGGLSSTGGGPVVTSLKDLSDVDDNLNPTTTGQVLTWNNTSQKWVVGNGGGGGSYLPLSGGTMTGNIKLTTSLYYNGTGSVQYIDGNTTLGYIGVSKTTDQQAQTTRGTLRIKAYNDIQLYPNNSTSQGLVISSSDVAFLSKSLVRTIKVGDTSYNATTGVVSLPAYPSAPGTLDTTNTTAQTTSASEALSGAVKLHKVSKTGSYSDLLNQPDLSVYVTTTALTTTLASYVTTSSLTTTLGGYLPLTGGTLTGVLNIKLPSKENTYYNYFKFLDSDGTNVASIRVTGLGHIGLYANNSIEFMAANSRRFFINSSGLMPEVNGTINIDSTTGAMTSLGNGYDIGRHASGGTTKRFIRSLRTKVIYLDDGVYLYYDTVNQCVRIIGAGLAAEGFVSAGGVSTT